MFIITLMYRTHTPTSCAVVDGAVDGGGAGGISMGALLIGSLASIIGIGAAPAMGGGTFAAISGGTLWRVPALRDETVPLTPSEADGPKRQTASDAARPTPQPVSRELRRADSD
jgi:hypothetical protein